MNRLHAALAFAVLTSCTTMDSVREAGDRSEHALRQSPHDAAGCMARGIERVVPGIQTSVRSGGSGSMEVIVRNGPDFVFAVADIAPATPAGSRANIWLKPGWFFRKDEWLPAMTNGC